MAAPQFKLSLSLSTQQSTRTYCARLLLPFSLPSHHDQVVRACRLFFLAPPSAQRVWRCPGQTLSTSSCQCMRQPWFSTATWFLRSLSCSLLGWSTALAIQSRMSPLSKQPWMGKHCLRGPPTCPIPNTFEKLFPAEPGRRSTAVRYFRSTTPSFFWFKIVSEPNWLYQVPLKLQGLDFTSGSQILMVLLTKGGEIDVDSFILGDFDFSNRVKVSCPILVDSQISLRVPTMYHCNQEVRSFSWPSHTIHWAVHTVVEVP